MLKIRISKKLKLKIIYPNTKFKDNRGIYLESFNQKKYSNQLKSIEFVEDDFSINKKNVFKGIHGDNRTWKLISCVYGKCAAYIVDCRKNSKTFGKWERFIISGENYFQILIPPKFGNSFLVLSKIAVYHYKQSKYYRGMNNQFTYKWNDPKINLKLNKNKIILSKRDSKN
ncbi:dTDP-4-dehydrorhamnose 3,5-epimerase family protein [Pelagibacterales bacterium SAG-MED22]|nr:dTDP-4-dehydrorhamnose 3,5-epimerase family protein [Pelagibacterales bacterium SAG-MED22]